MRATEKILPEHGKDIATLFSEMKDIKEEDAIWKNGKMLGYIYYPGDETAKIVQDAYQMFSHDNALNPSLFTSLKKFENETVSMVAELLNAGPEAAGNITSGGTESILMAVKTFRDKARVEHPEITRPEVLVPDSAHPAFDKAAHFLGLKVVHAPLRSDKRADTAELEKLISPETIMLVASAPCFPYGVIDPIEEIGKLAQKYNIPLHVDACLGGVLLPFAEMLGYQIPLMDFRVNGVTSISADIHKYGYSQKGASVIIYRNHEIRKHQFFLSVDWPGGIYGSTTLLGSRSGGPIAAAWAVMKYLGKDGYLKMAKEVMEISRKLQSEINSIEGLKVISDPEMSVFAFTSDSLDIFAIGDELASDGWHLNCLQYPKSLHITVSFNNVVVADEFLVQLRKATEKVRKADSRASSSPFVVSLVKNLSRALPEKWLPEIAAGASRFLGEKGEGKIEGNGDIDDQTTDNDSRKNVHEFALDILDMIYTL
jgi:tyrosine decarboxylase MnfA